VAVFDSGGTERREEETKGIEEKGWRRWRGGGGREDGRGGGG